MKVTDVQKFSGETVEFDGEDYLFIRYGTDCWMVHMGESDEPVHNSEKLEAAYQEWKKQHETN